MIHDDRQFVDVLENTSIDPSNQKLFDLSNSADDLNLLEL